MTVLLNVQELTKAYGSRKLFANLSFELRAGERVGLIGPNGAGKSTLLRLLAGREEADAGNRSLRRGIRIGYVTQDDVFPAGQTVREVVQGALADEAIDEHERSTQVSIALTRTGFNDAEQKADVLSGGWRKRLALAREMARRPDLLLLDEPTNHLDLPGVIWLERLLRAAPFGYVVITHDRAFLRAVADEIIEINRAYPGGFFRARLEAMKSSRPAASCSSKPRHAGRKRSPTRSAAIPNGWAARNPPSGASRLPASRRRAGSGRSWRS